MRNLSDKSAEKLQKIYSKKLNRELTRQELEQIYNELMDFAFALVELNQVEASNNSP